MAAAENAQIKEIDLINSTEVTKGVYTISSAGDYKFTCSNSQKTANRIVVDGTHISENDNIKIYLDNVNINTSAGPALQIQTSVRTQVYIYLEGINTLNNSGGRWGAALQKNNSAKLTIDNSPKTIGKLIAIGTYGAGIGGTGNGSNITINGGSVTATSYSGAGIGCPPHKNLNSTGNNPEVYLCTVSNPQKRNISIDGVDWITYNHVTNNSVDNNLYAWLTGAEHTITVGTEERKYSFNQNTKQFSRIKTDPTAAQLDFTPQNFTYNKDNPVDISNYIKWKDDVTGHGEITHVTYFKKEDGTSLTNSPTDAGTYTFKIDVNAGDYYNSAQKISASPEWEFIISKAQAPSNKPTNTTISVSWSCKKVEDVKNCFEDDWKWSVSDISKELLVEKEFPLQQFTLAKTQTIIKKHLLNLKSPEKHVHTHIPQNVTTPLHPVLPADTVEIPTAQTVMKHFPMVIRFPHTAMTMTTVLSLQNQLQKLTES